MQLENGEFHSSFGFTKARDYDHRAYPRHLGFFTKDYLPTSRGFSRYYGFLTGKEDYFLHEDMECEHSFAVFRHGYTPIA